MVKWTADTSVGELVADKPSRSRIFEQLGIDYCCGGRNTLADACENRGLDVNTVVQLLAALDGTDRESTEAVNWKRAPLSDLIDHIVEVHHGYLRRELPRLDALLTRVASRHGGQYPWLHEMRPAFHELASEMEEHLRAEEEEVFPKIREASAKPAMSLGVAVDQMEDEHETVGALLSQLRELSSGFTPPEGACNSFRALLDGLKELEADTHRHVHLENNILFRRALASESYFS